MSLGIRAVMIMVGELRLSYDGNMVNQEWISVGDKHLNRHAVGMKNECPVLY